MIKIIDLNKISEEYTYTLKKDENISIIPTSFDTIDLKKKIIFEVNDSNIDIKITFKAVVESNNSLDLNLYLSSKLKKIYNIKVYLEAYILNIGENNRIQLHPNLEIPQKNITFEHKLTIGNPNLLWTTYMLSRGLSKRDCLELIRKSFIS